MWRKFLEEFLVAFIGWAIMLGAAYLLVAFALFDFFLPDPALLRLALGWMIVAGVWNACKECFP
jgi:hypothetical protein